MRSRVTRKGNRPSSSFSFGQKTKHKRNRAVEIVSTTNCVSARSGARKMMKNRATRNPMALSAMMDAIRERANSI